MAKISGIGQRLFLGSSDLSGDVGAISAIGSTRNMQDVTSLRDVAMKRIGLLRDGTLSYTAYFDPASEHPVLRDLPQSTLVTWATRPTAGYPAGVLIANSTDYGVERGADGSIVTSPTASANGTGVQWGVLLTNGAQTFASSGAGTSVDDYVPIFGTLPLPSTHGLAAYLHVLSIGSGTATVHVQDSADNLSFADVAGAVFTGASGATSQRISVAGNVRRYLRVNVTGTFTNLVAAVTVVRNLS